MVRLSLPLAVLLALGVALTGCFDIPPYPAGGDDVDQSVGGDTDPIGDLEGDTQVEPGDLVGDAIGDTDSTDLGDAIADSTSDLADSTGDLADGTSDLVDGSDACAGAGCGSCDAMCASVGLICGPGDMCVECEVTGDCAGTDASCMGGMCVCGAGRDYCGGVGCVDFDSDSNHCGNCGIRCGAGELCGEGLCQTCGAAGLTDCAGTCVDTTKEPEHCGGCNRACLPGENCADSICTCIQAGHTLCAGVCTDLGSPSSCGSCTTQCTMGEVCDGSTCIDDPCSPGDTYCDGFCVDTNAEPFHCGGCGIQCGCDAECTNGVCGPTGTGEVVMIEPNFVLHRSKMPITIYTKGLTTTPTFVEMGVNLYLPTQPGSTPNHSIVIIDDTLTQLGVYQPNVGGCANQNGQVFTLFNDLDPSSINVWPQGVSNQVSTRIGLTGPAGSNQVSTRVWLRDPSTGAAAIELQEVTVLTDRFVEAIVPAGVPTGSYEVYVTGQHSELGLGALEVVNQPPIVIDGIDKDWITIGGMTTLRVEGSNLPNLSSASANFTCYDWLNGAELQGPQVTVSNGGGAVLVLTADASTVTMNLLCTLEISHTDGRAATWSTLSVKADSAQKSVWTNPMVDLSEPREGPVAVAAKEGYGHRGRIFVIGGSDALGDPLATVESLGFDRSGRMDPAFRAEATLSQARAHAGAVVAGDYIYVAGGAISRTGIVTDTVERAQILQPISGFNVTSTLVADRVAGGLPTGTWHYRVSAIFNPGDLANPGGESLATEPQLVVVTRDQAVEVTIDWTSVAGALRYRVYRSLMADAGIEDMTMLAEVAGTTFTDDGSTTGTVGQPKGRGALGNWASATAITVPKSRFGFQLLDSISPSDTAFFYIVGGTDGVGNPLSSAERCEVSTSTSAAVNCSSLPDLAAARMGVAMAHVSAGDFAPLTADNNATDPDIVLYALGGGTGPAVDHYEFVELPDTSGGFTTWSAAANANNDPGDFDGHALFSWSGHLYIVGAENGLPSDVGRFNTLADLGTATDGTVTAWTGDPDLLTTGRVRMGFAHYPPFMFLVGGIDPQGALRSMEYAVH